MCLMFPQGSCIPWPFSPVIIFDRWGVNILLQRAPKTFNSVFDKNVVQARGAAKNPCY